MDINWVGKILGKINLWSREPDLKVNAELEYNLFEIISDALYEKDLGILSVLKDELSLTLDFLKKIKNKNLDVIMFEIRLGAWLSLVKAFVLSMTEGDVFSAVDRIVNGAKVLRVIKENVGAGISNYDLLKSLKDFDLNDAVALEKVLGALIEIGCITRKDEYLFITEKGRKYFKEKDGVLTETS